MIRRTDSNLPGVFGKVAGTEKGLGREPEATFSTCFGAPFMPRHPSVYGDMLGCKIVEHGVTCWLVNTGWTGGPYGVGKRMSIRHTRALLDAALRGHLDDVPFENDPRFGLSIPTACPGVPAEVLAPHKTWADRDAYDAAADDLVARFSRNFVQFEEYVDAKVRAAGPKAAESVF